MLLKCWVVGVHVALMVHAVTPRDIIKITVNDTITVGDSNHHQLSYDLNETITVSVNSYVKYHLLVCDVSHLEHTNTVYHHQFKLNHPFRTRGWPELTAVNREFIATEEFKGLWNCNLLPDNPIAVKGKPQHLNFTFCLNVKDKNKPNDFTCEKYKDKYKIFTENGNESNIGRRDKGRYDNERTSSHRNNTANPDINYNINRDNDDASKNANEEATVKPIDSKNKDTTDGNNTNSSAIETHNKQTTDVFDLKIAIAVVGAIAVVCVAMGCVIGVMLQRKCAQNASNVEDNPYSTKDFTSQKVTYDNSEAASVANATHHTTSDPIYSNISSMPSASPYTSKYQNIYNGVATSPARVNHYVNAPSVAITTEEHYIYSEPNIVGSGQPCIYESNTDNTIYDVPYDRIKKPNRFALRRS